MSRAGEWLSGGDEDADLDRKFQNSAEYLSHGAGWVSPEPKKRARQPRAKAPAPADQDNGPRLTDRGNALRLVSRHGTNLRYCHSWKRWFTWDEKRWCMDETAVAVRMAKEVIAELLELTLTQIAGVTDRLKFANGDAAGLKKELVRLQQITMHCLKSEDARRLNAMVDLARSEPGIYILPSILDRDPWLLNCANGTVDLRTGKMHPHRREHYITKLCPTPYEPRARCPLWIDFLNKVFRGRDDLIEFVQRLLGCSLTGDVREQILTIFWGTGANGKSTLINALFAVLGRDYAMKAAPELVMVRSSDPHPTERADLFGKRLVVCSETTAGHRLNESLVKDVTGGEPIRARRMREDFWEFYPSHKLVMLTNHRPVIAGTDHGIWRRLRLVPFDVRFIDPDELSDGQEPAGPLQDKALPAKLQRECPGILAWCVRGCLDWQRHGLGMAQDVRQATAEYRSSEDLLAKFLAEKCVVKADPTCRCKASLLYAAFRAWCDCNGEDQVSQRAFGEAMTERGFVRVSSNGVMYQGVALKDVYDY